MRINDPFSDIGNMAVGGKNSEIRNIHSNMGKWNIVCYISDAIYLVKKVIWLIQINFETG